jgi:serine/threonine-protein kinase
MPYYDSAPWPVPSPAAVPLQQRQAKRRRRGAFSLVMLLLITAVLGAGAWYLLAGRFTVTPDFDNLTQAQAIALANKNGLQVAWAEEFSETVPVGQVTHTDPAAGDRVARGGTVTVYLSKGQERYPVPSLAGRTPEDAAKVLQDNHLTAGKQVEVYDESVPIGTVVSGSIEAGKQVKPGTVVDINVSKGPAPVKIVSFKGKPFDEAKAYYENAGLVVQRAEDAFDDKIVAGNVISSDPKTGSSLPRGETITFTVSKGPEMIPVPGVGGLSATDARKKLKDAGFVVKLEKHFFGKTVWGTNPGEGTVVAKGSTVILILV